MRISITPTKITDNEFHYNEHVNGKLTCNDYWLVKDAPNFLNKVNVQINLDQFIKLAHASNMMTKCYGGIISARNEFYKIVLFTECPHTGKKLDQASFSFTEFVR